jgi:hypothetical protein
MKYSRNNTNEYHFRTSKLEASRALAATSNNGVVTSATNASCHIIDYYGALQKIIEYTIGA